MAKKSKKRLIYVTQMDYADGDGKRLFCIVVKKSLINTFGTAKIISLIADDKNIRTTKVTDTGFLIFFKTKTREKATVDLCDTLKNHFQQRLLAETKTQR